MKQNHTYLNDDWDKPKKTNKKNHSEKKVNKYKNYLHDDDYMTFEKTNKRKK